MQDDRGGATIINAPVIGVVKDNIDPAHAGRIRVYISKFGGLDSNDSSNWKTVSYMSPFSGMSGMSGTAATGSTSEGYGEFVDNPQSYGFWAASPDIGTNVICLFVDGDPQNGYYIGCIPKPGMNSMTPAMGATNSVVPNSAEASALAGADRMMTTEVNSNNPNLANSGTITTDPKPVHSYQMAIMAQQGLNRDNSKGMITSSAQRETPSKVFGISSPGGPIYSGGFNNSTIIGAVTDPATDTQVQVKGRTGGHSLVLDDGDLQGQNQLMRFRSAAGHQIMMNDTDQGISIIHANGQSWAELGKEGTIDLYCTNSFNVRSQGDINFHSDRDINMHAEKTFRMYATNIQIESDNNTSFRSGNNFFTYVKGKYTIKVDSSFSILSTGDASLASSGKTFINGDKINLNTGSAGTTPIEVPIMPKTSVVDAAYSKGKGWINPSPTPTISLTNRTPTHLPFAGSGKGVDVTINPVVDSSKATTTPAADTANSSTPAVPAKPVPVATVNSVPAATAASSNAVPELNGNAIKALTGQQAQNNATLPNGVTPQAVPAAIANAGTSNIPLSGIPQINPNSKAALGILAGSVGLNLNQATISGSILKPGSGSLISVNLAMGMPFQMAIQGLTTGNFGAVSASAVLRSTSIQTAAMGLSINASATSLVNSGILTGQESAAQAGGLVMAASNYGTTAVSGFISARTMGTGVSGSVGVGANFGGVGSISGGLNVGGGGSNVGINANIGGLIGGGALGNINISANIGGKAGATIKTGLAVAGAAVAAGVTVNAISNAISSGKLAGSIADTISSGLSGLATSVADTLKNLGQSIASAAASLIGPLRAAFAQVEASLTELQANLPNFLGGSDKSTSSVDVNSSGSKYNSTQAAVKIAQSNYDMALTNYRNVSDNINKAALDSAESDLEAARKESGKAAIGLMTGTANGINSAGNALNSLRGAASGVLSIGGISVRAGIPLNGVAGGIMAGVSGGLAAGGIVAGLSANAGGITAGLRAGISGGLASASIQLPVTTFNSGINGLSGGLSAMASFTNATNPSNLIKNISGAASFSTSGGISGSLGVQGGFGGGSGSFGLSIQNPLSLTGNLVGNTTRSIGSISAGLSAGINGGLSGGIGINANLGGVQVGLNANLGGVVGGIQAGITGGLAAASLVANGSITAGINGISAGIRGSIGGISGGIAAGLQAGVSGGLAAGGIIASLQASIASIGNASGQIKTGILASGTFLKAGFAVNTGKLLNNSIIPMPLSVLPGADDGGAAVNTSTNQLAAKTLGSQSEALKKIKEIEDKLAQARAQISEEVRNQTQTLGLFDKIASYAKVKGLESDLEKATEQYNSLVSGQNTPPPDPRPATASTATTASVSSQPQSQSINPSSTGGMRGPDPAQWLPPPPIASGPGVETSTGIDQYGQKITTTTGGGTSRFIPPEEAMARRNAANR